MCRRRSGRRDRARPSGPLCLQRFPDVPTTFGSTTPGGPPGRGRRGGRDANDVHGDHRAVRMAYPPGRMRLVPWGLLGMLGLVVAVERFVASHEFDLTANPMFLDWRESGRASRRQAARAEVLVL